MRGGVIAAALILAALGLVAWIGDWDTAVMRWALAEQRDTQNGLARALRGLRAGDPGALAAFLTLCFAYGFFHAAGPGHGKILIGGYGAARRVGALRLSGIALVSSLAQALTAVALVGAGLWLLGWGRERMTGLADEVFQPLSFVLIALVGLWLAGRGVRGLWRLRAPALATAEGGADLHAHHTHDHHSHAHDTHDHHTHAHDTHAHCDSCGHAHAPDLHSLAAAKDWRDVALLVGAVAVRPCTGALFVLILTAQMGLFAIGVAGALAMGVGTASVTVAVAIAAVTLREGALASLPGSSAVARAQPVLELTVGIAVALISLRLALATI